jgi:uncharacterized protein YkwD
MKLPNHYRGFPNSVQSKTDLLKKTNSEKVTNGYASSDEEEFAKEGLRVHNEYRRKHGVPDLKLSESVRQRMNCRTQIMLISVSML